MIHQVAQGAALVGYFLGVFLAVLNARTPSEKLKQASTMSLLGAWILQTGAVVGHTIARGTVPLDSLEDFLLMLSWVVLGFHLYLWFRRHLLGAVFVLPPIAFVAAVLGIVIPAPHLELPRSHETGWLYFHLGLTLVGIAALSVAFAMSLIYLVQDRALKSKRPLALLEKLPSLDTCDRVGFHAFLAGFGLLTLGIATGLVLGMVIHHRYWNGNPKEILSYLAWFVFALLFYARLSRGLRGRKSAYLTITGYALAILTIATLVP